MDTLYGPAWAVSAEFNKQLLRYVPIADQSLLNTLRPPAPSPQFTGRTEELDLITKFFYERLEGDFVLTGAPGSGKTQLALKCAELMASCCSEIFYLDTESAIDVFPGIFMEPSLLQAEVKLNAEIEESYPLSDSDDCVSEAISNQSSRVALVIFDGLDPAGFAAPCQHLSSRRYVCRVLGYQKLAALYLLNPEQGAYRDRLETYHLSDNLDIEAAATLLIKSLDPQSQIPIDDKETAVEIAQHFYCSLRTMIHIGNVMKHSEMTLQAYRLMTSSQRREWKADMQSSQGSPWIDYGGLPTSSQTLSKLFVLLQVDRLSLLKEIMIQARKNLTSYQSQVLANNEAERAKTEIQKILSWFTFETSGTFRCNLHFNATTARLTDKFGPLSRHPNHNRRLGRAELPIKHEPFIEATAVYLLALAIGPESDFSYKCRVFRAELAPLVDKMLVLNPVSCERHYRRFMLVHEAGNRWKDAIDLQKKLLEKYRAELGHHHTDTVYVSKSLTSTYCKIGRWRDAKELLATLLGHQKGALGELHIDTMSTTHDLASTISHLDRWEDAEIMLELVHNGRRQILGESDPDILSVMHDLALNYSEQGRWQEGQELHEQVLQARKQTLGKLHPDTLSSMHSLATKHFEAQQSIFNAEILNELVLEARKEALGPAHPDTLSSMFALALVYRRQGQWREAAELGESVVEIQRKVRGRDHVDTIMTMYNLASWYLKDGRLNKAAALQTEILESRRVVYDDASPEILASIGELASTCSKLGRWGQAESLHLEQLEVRKRTLGDDDPTSIATSLDLATHYLDQCRWRKALLIYREVLEIKRKDQELEADDPVMVHVQKQLDLTLFALSLDVFIVSPTVPMKSVVAHFTGRAGLQDYTTQLQKAQNRPVAPMDGGGYSDIYRFTFHDGRDLAVKCLKKLRGEYEQVQETIRELSAWSHLRHERVVPLLGLALFRGQLAMVSPWSKKGNVMRFIEQQPDLDRYALCVQVVKAVVYLHALDVVHGDLKGCNILVSDDNTLQLTDFGLTIMHDTAIQYSTKTDVEGGTTRWMAPELLFDNETAEEFTQRASRPITEKLKRTRERTNNSESSSKPKICKATDIYALGMTMLELLTGKRPFDEVKNDQAVISKVDQGKRPNRPKDIPDKLWSILEKCWAQQPADRPTAKEVESLILQAANR